MMETRPGPAVVPSPSLVAQGPASRLSVPLASDAPDAVSPERFISVGRFNDFEWAIDVNMVHGQVVRTADDRIWFLDLSDLGTWTLQTPPQRLPRGRWCEVSGQTLALGEPSWDPSRLLRFELEGAAAGYQEPETVVTPGSAPIQPASPWQPVPMRLVDGADDVSSGYRIVVGEQSATLPFSGAPIPFGREAALARIGGLVLPAPDVSRIHGFFRFNPLAGEGSVEVYSGNGMGRPSTNPLFRIRPGQILGSPLLPGQFTPLEAGDLVTVAAYSALVTHDAQHPRHSRKPGLGQS